LKIPQFIYDFCEMIYLLRTEGISVGGM